MILKNNSTNLFIIENDKIVVNPKALLIPEFALIYERDRSTGKKRSLKEFTYIHYVADYKSEYNRYGLLKESQLGFDIFNNKNYNPDPDIKNAIEKYKELQQSPSMQYLVAIRNRVNRIIQYLSNAEIDDKDREGKYINPFIQIDKVTKVLKELEDVVEKLEKWEKKVFDEEEDMQIRGGGVLNAFENPEDAKWLNR